MKIKYLSHDIKVNMDTALDRVCHFISASYGNNIVGYFPCEDHTSHYEYTHLLPGSDSIQLALTESMRLLEQKL